jgi:GNAT superfamily N-acetyltransferase
MQTLKIELLPHKATKEAVNAIVELNKSYPPELQIDKKEAIEILTELLTINYVLRLDNKIIGSCLYRDIRGYPEDDFKNEETGKIEWSPREFSETYNSDGAGILYIEDTTILPEYRNKGFAKFLREKTYQKLKNDWNFIVAHANSGAMINISKELGGNILKEFPNWFGSGETHVLYEIDLKKPRTGTIAYGKWKQETEYTCGLASIRNLLFNVGIVVTERELIKFGYCSKKIGTSPCDLVRICQNYDIGAVWSSNTTIGGIKAILQQNKPCIVNYQSGKWGHWSLIHGIKDNKFLLFDCDGGREKKITFEKFEQNFYSKVYGKCNMIYLY